ncbi:polysaccharide lyase 6 family protein [Vibrio fortis]|uniref:polysaccharide lyase 6 family protein n=1 Tax=Vibrio fortis TaxID=212667 RepID=UPI003EC011F9
MKLSKLSVVLMLILGVGCSEDSTTTPNGSGEETTPPEVPGGSNDVLSDLLPEDILTVPSVQCSEVFGSTSELENAVSQDMAAGTTLCLADGEYVDLEITYGGTGTKESPIKVAAQNPGKAVITGNAKIAMGGSYVQLQGFVFDGATSSSSNLIATRFGTHNLCHNCRITEIAIIDVDADQGITSGDSTSGEWVHIYGKNNWLDHSILSGKTTASPMISFNRWVSGDWDEETQLAELAQGIIVYNNYIANRAPAEGQMYAQSSDNNYEAIRTGLSDTHQYAGDSLIVRNVFENIQGEAEVVSNKGTNNTISFNTVLNSYGSITTRHGSGATISNNFILSQDYPFAGGLRLVDGDHVVTNNYIQGARYKNTTHHGGIVLMGSDGAGDGDNGYQQFENVHVAHNTIVDSVNSLNIDGGGKSTAPKLAYLANNLVDKAIGPVLTQSERGFDVSTHVTGNVVFGQEFADSDTLKVTEPGFEFYSANLVQDEKGIYRPSLNSPNLDAITDYEKGEFSDVVIDLDGQERSETTTVGADESLTSSVIYEPLSYDDVGPLSYSLVKPQAIMIEVALQNSAFDEGLSNWSYQNASTVTGEQAFSRDSSLQLQSNSVVSQDVALEANTRYAISAFVKGAYQLSLGDEVTVQGQDVGDYTWVSEEFTAQENTVASLKLSLPESITVFADIADHQLGQWRADGGTSTVWAVYEGSSEGKGDVGSSGDSAFSDALGSNGSARIRFKYGESTHDFDSKPGISQVVDELPTGTDMTFAMYYCDKKGEDSLSTLHYGLRLPNSGTIVAEARAHVKDLDDAPQGSIKDCFRQVTLDFNTQGYDSLEIFALMEIDTINFTSEQILAHEQFIDDELEIRIDEFSIRYPGDPADGLVGYVDDVRLVKRVER